MNCVMCEMAERPDTDTLLFELVKARKMVLCPMHADALESGLTEISRTVGKKVAKRISDVGMRVIGRITQRITTGAS